VLAQGVAHRAQRRLGDRFHSVRGRPAASVPGARLGPLLRRIGVTGPGYPYSREVPGAIRFALNPDRLLGSPDRRLAHPELAGELPITGRAHP
jgi:hypothetical protein